MIVSPRFIPVAQQHQQVPLGRGAPSQTSCRASGGCCCSTSPPKSTFTSPAPSEEDPHAAQDQPCLYTILKQTLSSWGNSAPFPATPGILLKLFCQHPDQAGLMFNDTRTLLLHSYKDCFDTSRIFDSPVKIKHWKLNKNSPWMQKSLNTMSTPCRMRSGLASQLAATPSLLLEPTAQDTGLLINCCSFLRLLSAPKLFIF